MRSGTRVGGGGENRGALTTRAFFFFSFFWGLETGLGGGGTASFAGLSAFARGISLPLGLSERKHGRSVFRRRFGGLRGRRWEMGVRRGGVDGTGRARGGGGFLRVIGGGVHAGFEGLVGAVGVGYLV